jgi:hypothetical protein
MKKILFHGSKKQGLKKITPNITNSYREEGEVVFASKNPSFAAIFGAYWADKDAQITTYSYEEYEYPNEENVYKITFDIFNQNNIDLDSSCSMYQIEGEFEYLRNEKDLEQISKEPCEVLSEYKYKNFKEMLENFGVKINYLQKEANIINSRSVYSMSNIQRGDFVSWDNPGGRARGKVVKIVEDGKIDGIKAKIIGTKDEPAAKILLYRKEDGKWEKTDIYVGHKIKSLRKIKPLIKFCYLNLILFTMISKMDLQT